MKVLLAVDGSPLARKACRYLIRHWPQLGAGGTLTLLHVDPALPGNIAMVLGRDGVAEYHRDNHKAALAAVQRALKRAGVAFEVRTVVAQPGEAIPEIARGGRYDLVVMGSHGRGVVRALLLGSVVSKVLAAGDVPVLVVR